MWLWKDTYLLDILVRGEIDCKQCNAWWFSLLISDFDRMFDKSVLFIFPVCLLTVTWNIPKFFEFKTCYLPLKVMGDKNISIIISFLLKKLSSNQSCLEEESGKFRGSYKNNDA